MAQEAEDRSVRLLYIRLIHHLVGGSSLSARSADYRFGYHAALRDVLDSLELIHGPGGIAERREEVCDGK